MRSSNVISKPDVSFGRSLVDAIRYYAGNRRALIVLATLAAIAGAALNWSWLVALGVAPILLTALPCLAMCALGLCMHRAFGRGDRRGSSTETSGELSKTDQACCGDTARKPALPPAKGS